MESWEIRDKLIRQLDSALATLRKNGIEWAEAEYEYRKLKTKEILRLKDEGYPATLIIDIVRGLGEVPELDFKRNSAKVVYSANAEAINVKKLELKSIENDISREWGKNE